MDKCCGAGQATDDNIVRRMCVAYWITKATNTHWECVMLNAFQRQQWSRDNASMLYNAYIACLVWRIAGLTGANRSNIVQRKSIR